jgi:hypothetical protein
MPPGIRLALHAIHVSRLWATVQVCAFFDRCLSGHATRLSLFPYSGMSLKEIEAVVSDLLSNGSVDVEEIRERIEDVVRHAKRKGGLLRTCDSSLVLSALEASSFKI